jgi:hypothetical protein
MSISTVLSPCSDPAYAVYTVFREELKPSKLYVLFSCGQFDANDARMPKRMGTVGRVSNKKANQWLQYIFANSSWSFVHCTLFLDI